MSNRHAVMAVKEKSKSYYRSMSKLQISIKRITACYEGSVKVTAEEVLNKHKLYDSSAQDLREALAFFEAYLDNITHSIACDLNEKKEEFRA